MDKWIIWTIYERPSDFPDKFVLRSWEVEADSPAPMTASVMADTIDEIRNLLPRGLVCLAGCTHHDPRIVETWL